MIKAFEIILKDKEFRVKKTCHITTNAKEQYYACVAIFESWKDRNVRIVWNGVAMPVKDGICIIPQLTKTEIIIGVLLFPKGIQTIEHNTRGV